MEDSKNITLKVNSKLYKHEGWIISRQFEKCIESELKKRGNKK